MPSKRPYETSHPWLTFGVDLRRLPFTFWVQLGEVQSKCRHVAETLLPPAVQRDFYEVYLAKGAHATTAIEGNTLTEGEVLKAVRGALNLPPSQEYRGKEVANVIRACNDIALRVFDQGDTHISAERICEFNRQVLEGLPLDDHVLSGVIRRTSVGVANYRGAPWEDCEHLLERLCEWLETGFEAPSEDFRTGFAVIKAALAHLYLAWIHPFGDGNGRTARLLEFAILLGAGIPDVSAHLLSNHYNETRDEYYRQLDYASRSKGDVSRFLQYAVEGFRDGLVSQIERITAYQYVATWREYVYEQIPVARTEPLRRQREIALALWQHPEGIAAESVRYLTPRIAEAYAGKQDRTIKRDLTALEQRNLIDRAAGRILARFRPVAERRPRRIGE